MPSLSQINIQESSRARELFLHCCGSQRWADAMVAARPFATEAILLKKAREIWLGLSEKDWREAFSAHPRIGERGKSHENEEQSGARSATKPVLDAIAQGNSEYERRFGYVFLICASGKSAEEMLSHLEMRLGQPAEAEIVTAAGEQSKITQLRLERMLQT